MVQHLWSVELLQSFFLQTYLNSESKSLRNRDDGDSKRSAKFHTSTPEIRGESFDRPKVVVFLSHPGSQVPVDHHGPMG